MLNKNQKFTFYNEVGNRVCIKLKDQDIIIIRPNKKFNLLWGLGFVIAGIFISLFLSKGEGQINIVTIAIITAPGLLFVIIGLLYLYKTKNKSLWIIDPKTRSFNLNNRQILPFEEIIELKMTSTLDYSSIESFTNREIHELYLITKKNLKLRLFQSESKDAVFEAGKFLCETMNIRLD